jgi:site-specific DNA-methyltransferase (adenine-specific)
MNRLYYGDNLRVLRDSIADESVDLIYLDPPFNSNASYNVLFRATDGSGSAAQIEAFDDTWHWTKVHKRATSSGCSSHVRDISRRRSFRHNVHRTASP